MKKKQKRRGGKRDESKIIIDCTRDELHRIILSVERKCEYHRRMYHSFDLFFARLEQDASRQNRNRKKIVAKQMQKDLPSAS